MTEDKKRELELHREKQKNIKDVEEAIMKAIDVTNYSRDSEVSEGIVRAFMKSHPTLVQSFMREFKEAATQLKETPKFDGNDPRCFATGSMLCEISNSDVNFPFI